MDMEKALKFASSVTTMRGQISDLNENDVAILLTAKNGSEESSITCVTSGNPGAWEVLGLLEYALVMERRMIEGNAEVNSGEGE